MCGIVGYVGRQDAVPVLLEGLARLEYRGYDSAGVAVVRNGSVRVHKQAGKVRDLGLKHAQAPQRPGRHRAHALGHAWTAERHKRPPAHGYERSDRGRA